MSDSGASCWLREANDGYATLEDGSPARVIIASLRW